MKNAIIVAVVLVVGAAAFWGGGLYKEQKIRANPRSLFGQLDRGGALRTQDGQRGGLARPGGGFGGGQGGPGGLRGGGAPVISGTLDEVTDDELTLTTNFGSVTVKIDDKTKIKQAQETEAEDLKVKEDVIIEGEQDDDGNLTAKVVIQ